jgi:glycosyltransferase involved in cell wall biosynthesis
MKILMIAPEPFFEPRGTPISVYQRLHAVSNLDHQVDLVVYHLGKDVNIPGVTLYRIPRLSFIREVKIGPSWPKLLLDMLVFFQSLKLMMVNKYDVVHSHEEAAFFSMFLAALFRIPHLYDMHSSLARQIESSKYGTWPFLVNLFKMLERLTLFSSQGVITIGADLQEYVKQINPAASPMLIENLPLNSFQEFSTNSLAPELRKKLNLNGHQPVVYTGSFESYQGLNLLMESAVIVKERNPNALFILVGGKPHQVNKIKEIARQSDLLDCFRFIGTVSPQEAIAYLEIAEVLISPRVEGLSVPLKIYSYLYSGKPFVATRIQAHTMVLDDQNSMLVEPNKEAFAEGILQVLDSRELREDMSSRARSYAKENFSFVDYTEKVNQVYEALERVPHRLISHKKTLNTTGE